MDLNPSVDPRSLSVGEDIRLEAQADAGSGSAGSEAPFGNPGSYRVEQGDTLFSIAQALSVSLFELINANNDVNPCALAVGELLDVPGRDRPGASVWIAPNSGTVRDEVTLKARNLRPGGRATG